jgi:hypothetical protein
MSRASVLLIVVFLATFAFGQGKQSPARVVAHPVTAEVQACRDRLKEFADLGGHIDALSLERLSAVQQEITDCMLTESGGLSKDEIVTAFKLRDATGRESSKRIRDAAKTISDDDKRVRDLGLKIAQKAMDEDKGYRELIERYNTLVDAYNSTLRDYQAAVVQNREFLERMKSETRTANLNCQMQALDSLLKSASQSEPTISYRPPPQVHCTTQNIPAAIPGMPSWSYTNCN